MDGSGWVLTLYLPRHSMDRVWRSESANLAYTRFTTLRKTTSRRKLGHIMLIVSLGDCLYEMSKPISQKVGLDISCK